MKNVLISLNLSKISKSWHNSDFTSLRQLEKRFGISHKISRFLADVTEKEPSVHLAFDIEEAQEIPLYNSKKAKSELLIMPILKEIRRNNKFFNIFLGYNFDVNGSIGFNGFCDFLLSTDIQSLEVNSVVFCIVEAKNRSVEEGFAQAGAEMLAAQQFNEAEGKPTPVVFGSVTNGNEWVFLKLENQIIYIDPTRFSLEPHSLPTLLGAL